MIPERAAEHAFGDGAGLQRAGIPDRGWADDDHALDLV